MNNNQQVVDINQQIATLTKIVIEGATFLRELYKIRDRRPLIALYSSDSNVIKVYDLEAEGAIRRRKRLLQQSQVSKPWRRF